MAELARELGVPVSRVVEELDRIGTRVESAHTVITDEAVFAVWPVLKPSGPRSDGDLSTTSGSGAAMRPSAGADAWGFVAGAHVEMLGRMISQRFRLRPSEASDLAVQWIDRGLGMDAAERFWEVGFGPYDHGVVGQCVDQGLDVAVFYRTAQGRKAVRRLRGGESVAAVAASLRAGRG